MCYKFAMVSFGGHDVFSYHRTMNSLVNPGMFFEISLVDSEWFKYVTNVDIVIYAADNMPITRKAFSAQFTRDMNLKTLEVKSNSFSVRQQLLTTSN